MKRTFLKTFTAVLLMLCMLLHSGMAVTAVETKEDLTVMDLKTDYTTNPIGIDNPKPILSWKIDSDTRGTLQSEYRVGVASTLEKAEAGQYDIWDSRIQKSDAQAVTVDADLKEKTTYYWKVIVRDNQGGKAESDIATFETGFLADSVWDAKWIELPADDTYAPANYTIDFDFRLIKDNLGFVFAAKDATNFLMWQINTFESKFGGQMSLRPHQWTNGNASVIAETVLSEAVMPKSDYFKSHHMTIAVTGNRIVTSIDGNVVDDRTHSAAAFGKIGFRQTTVSGDCDERGAFDNVVVKDGEGAVLFSEDFESGVNTSFEVGNVENGELVVVNALGLQKDGEDSAPMYRKDFNVSKTVEKARVYASALGIYELEINGKKVGEDYFNPGWTAYTRNPDPEDNYVMYQTFDVSDYLQDGRNVIGAMTGHGWYSGKLFVGGNNRYGVGSKLLCQLEITYTDGSRDIIATDNSWMTCDYGPILSDDFQLGETYDARQEIDGWSAAGLDTTGWNAAAESSYDGGIIAQIGPAVREVARFEPVSIDKRPDGKYIVDFGQNIAGMVQIFVKGKAGDTVTLRHGEMLNGDGSLYTDNLRSASATDHYILKGDTDGETYSPRFTFHGFRYAEVSGYPGELTTEHIEAIAISSLQEQTGSFETSNELVNQLQSNITWGQLDNFISVPTDCPQRDERLGYTGDGQVFVGTAAYNRDVKEFFKKYMLDVTTNQRENGAIADWTPNYVTPGDDWSGSFGTAGWGDAVVIIPWTMYNVYGDKTVITDNFEAMKAWIGYYESIAGNDKIVDSAGHNYGDWLSVNSSTPLNVLCTAYFGYCANLLSKMATIIGEDADATYYSELFEEIKADFNKTFVTSDGVVATGSQTCYLLALHFDLLPTQDLRQKAAAKLVEDIKAHDWHLTTGFLGVSYLNPVLTEMGYGDVAYRLLLQETYPSWLYSVVNGATTIWERWNSYNAETGTFGDVGMNSFNHYSLGSVGEWFYKYSAGIQWDPEQPGFKHTVIQPTVGGGLDYVKASYETEYGTVRSGWSYEGADTLLMEVSIPAGTTATVYVPAESADGITESGVDADGAEGVKFIEYADGKAVYEVGSGDYTFRAGTTRKVMLTIKNGDSNLPCTVQVNGETAALPYMGEFEVGEEVTITASPVNTADNAFSYWSGDLLTDEAQLKFTIEESMALKAHCIDRAQTSLAKGKAVSVSSDHNAPPTWSASNLTNGDTTSDGGYSSGASHTDDLSSAPHWIEIDLGADTAFDRLHLYARRNSVAADGSAASFPKDYKIQVKKAGESAYTTLHEATGDTVEKNGVRVIELDKAVTGRYIRIEVSRLGGQPTDDSWYRLQFSEVGVYNSADQVDAPDKLYLQALCELAESVGLKDEALTAAQVLLRDPAAMQDAIDAAEAALEEVLAGIGTGLMGDVDFSGKVDVADIMKLKALIMADKWSAEELAVGDMDGSKKLDVGDIMAIKNIIMSK